jgi:hypothetical protein
MKPRASGPARAYRRAVSGSTAAPAWRARGSIGPTVIMKMAISTKVMPATLSRCPSQAVSRDDQLRPGSPSMRCGPSSTSRCQATMNIVVGTTSTAFSTMAAIGDSETRPPTMRMTIDMIQGMVTRWKNSRVLAKKKPKLSDSTWLSDSRTI